MIEFIHHPGYHRSYHYELEIVIEEREKQESIFLILDSFNLPERQSRTFDIVWGPGAPPITYPGPSEPFQLNLDITNFYEERIVQFLWCWYEDCLIDILGNLRQGHVIGYDDERVVQYKADISYIWPIRIALGEKNRDTQRQRVQAILALYDILHDEQFSLQRSEDICLPII